MSLFAHNFRELVLPRLARAIQAEAFMVAAGSTRFGEATEAVFDIAHSRGAAYLPPDVYDDLHDWIAGTLLVEIDAADAKVAATERDLAAAEQADPVAYYTSLAAPSPSLQWLFAAISPAYRAHLVAVTCAS